MTKNYFLLPVLTLTLFSGPEMRVVAQESEPNIRVVVDMVQLNVAVTDNKGNYITGLHPSDFAVVEDGIPQKLATFGEGDEPAYRVVDGSPADGKTAVQAGGQRQATDQKLGDDLGSLSAMVAGANVFLLFDTSNYMYRGFVFAQDAIADFVRSLESADKVAFYSYSRDLSRSAPLTPDREAVLRGVRATVAGDDAALYNCLLLTVKDAAHYTGRKVVVVFSNGPDNSSMVPPEDVAELAQSSGIAIYMISTQLARIEPVSTAVFERMTAATGGKAFLPRTGKANHEPLPSFGANLRNFYPSVFILRRILTGVG